MLLVSFNLSIELVKLVKLHVSSGGQCFRATHIKHISHMFFIGKKSHQNLSSTRLGPWGRPLWWSDQQWKTIHEPRQAAQPSWRPEMGIRTCRDLLTLFFPYAPACNRTWDVSMTSAEFASSGRFWLAAGHLPLLPCRPCMSMISIYIIYV